MKFTTAFVISASATLATAQGATYNSTTGQFTCAIPDAVYCAGDSLSTNIIIRCTGTVGYPGNCNDNLAGEPPMGVNPTQCYAPEDGKAACAKNCIVYGGSGNLPGQFTLPADQCTPIATASSSTLAPTNTTSIATNPPTSSPPPVTTLTSVPPPINTTIISPPPPTTVPGETVTITITSCPANTVIPPPTSVSNGTAPPTTVNTPVGPTGTTPVTAIPNSAAAGNAGLGLALAALAFALAV